MLAAILRLARRTVRQSAFSLALRNRTTGHGLVARIIAAALAYIMFFTALPPLPAHAEWRAGLPAAVTTPALPASARAATTAATHNLLRAITPKAVAPLLFADLFGPRVYTRGTGAPVTITDNFPLPAGAQAPFLLCVLNGAPDGTQRVSSAWIKLNGQDIFRPRDFNQQVSTLSAAVEPTATNQLQVRLMSAPGSFLTITLASDCHAPTNERPTANAGADQSVTLGGTALLSGTASSDPDGDTLTYQWSLVSVPSGSSATLSSAASTTPTFVVDKPGSYTARLVVSDGHLQSAPDDVVISTVNSAPVALAGADQSVTTHKLVHLNGSDSSDVDGDPLTYQWQFLSIPDGSTAVLADANTVSPSFTTDKRGDYVVELTISDGQATSTDQVVVTTVNSASTADAGPDQSAIAAHTVQLNGSGSTDVDGDAIIYRWALISRPAGSTAVLSSETAVNPTFTADLIGTYVAQLTVNDGLGESAPDTVTITTGNTAPVAVAGDDQSVELGSLVTLDGSGSSDADGHHLIYTWSLISQPTNSIAVLSDPSTVAPSFTADRAGTYVAQLAVNDGFVSSAPSTVSITTLNSRPVADPGTEQTVATGATVQLSGANSNDADGEALSYSWSLLYKPNTSNAALSDATAISPTFVADGEGVYVAQLIVSDGKVNSLPQTVMITAVTPNAAPHVFAGPDQRISLPTNSVFLSPTVTDDGKPVGVELTRSWTQLSGPAGVVFDFSPTAPAQAIFPGVGTYVLRLTVSDTEFTVSDDLTVIVDPPANQAPVVSAGSAQTISLPITTVTLHGTATDDSKPINTLAIDWSVVSAPAAVTFADAQALETAVSFAGEGTYVLRLTASDSELSSFADVTITVLPASANHAPVISTGDMALTLPNNALILSATVTDDGLPNGQLSSLWTQLDGPIAVQFADATRPNTRAIFDAPGTYTLRISATDGVLSTFKDIHVTVFRSVTGGNQAPFVDAGRDQIVTLPATTTLRGVAVDDGLPAGSTLVATWQQVSGPAAATISDVNAQQPTVTFTAAGTYTFRLFATDSEAASFDEVIISVNQLTGTLTNRGTDFWLMFPVNGDLLALPTLELHISGEPGTSGVVEIPALDSTQTFTVAANGSIVVTLPNNAFVVAEEVIDKKSIHVTSTLPIAVSGMSTRTNTADAFLALPRQILGTDYIVAAYRDTSREFDNTPCCRGTYGAIVAPIDGTTVTITPSVSNNSRTAGTPYRVVLNRGDVYQIKQTTNAPIRWDVTGTLISSDKPVAVFGGHQCVYILATACDFLIEQITPVNTWGSRFLTMPLATRTKGDLFRVIASADGTNITYGEAAAALDRGQHFDVVLQAPTEFRSDKPVMLLQYATGGDFDGNKNADPFMAIVPPVEQYGGDFTVEIPSTIYPSPSFSYAPNFANLITATNSVSSLRLDGQPLAASVSKSIGDSGFSGAQIALTPGVHKFSSSAPFGGWIYGWGQYVSYGYLGSFALPASNDETLQLFPTANSISSGSSACVVALVKDVFGPYVGGVAVNFAISGVNTATGHPETDANGRASFCYPATSAGTDTIVASIGSQTKTTTVTIAENLGNTAPQVAIDAASAVTLPAQLRLVGLVVDDGLPVPNVFSMTWSKVSGPGTVTFTASPASATDATFSAPGMYLVRLTVSDGSLASSADVTITVDPAAPANQAPQVNAGPDKTLDLSTVTEPSITLTGTATDDGRPAGKKLQYQWSAIGGSGSNGIFFSNGNESTTRVIFPIQANGLYTLRLTVTDGALTSSDDVNVNVIAANTRPVVISTFATPNSVTLPANTVTLTGSAFDDGKPIGVPLTYLWRQVAGPAQASISSPTSISTGVTFSAAGQYGFEFSVSDGVFTQRQSLSVTVRPANVTPTVNITNGGQTITLPTNKVTLNLTYNDDGVPQNGSPTTQWIQTQGPAAASFADATFTSTDILFTVSGTYNFKVIASDGELSAEAATTIRVLPDNVAPTVSAGQNRSITLPANSVTLTATATDDNKPTSTLTYSWTQTSGPAAATIASPTALSTGVTFPVDGTYVFQFTASDSLLSSSATVSVFVYPAATNQAPTVYAGDNRFLTLSSSNTASTGFNSSVTDDGLPVGSVPTYQWSLVSGPAAVNFNNNDRALTPIVTFSAPGTYVLRLTASDTALTGFATTQVVVLPRPNLAPQMSAGPGQTITLPATAATLSGTATDDGLPIGVPLTYKWVQLDGPAACAIASPASLTTNVNCANAGIYTFRLTVSDSENAVSQNVNVTVVAANKAPSVSLVADTRTIVLPNNTVNLGANVSDDGMPSNTLTYKWEVIFGPGAPVTFSSPTSPNTAAIFTVAGDYTLRLVVSDGALNSVAEIGVTVLPAITASTTLSATILAPEDGSYITKPVVVQGTVQNGTWKLEYSENTDDGSPSQQWFMLGSNLVGGDTPSQNLGTFDPTTLKNGSYTLRLTATNTIYGTTSVDQIGIVVGGNNKVGNFTMSFNDMTVPIANLPIQIIRTNDSKDRRILGGDFGLGGWSLSLKSVRLQKSGPTGRNWFEDVNFVGQFTRYCLSAIGHRTVTATFPDGRVYRFEAASDRPCQTAGPISAPTMVFQQTNATAATAGATLVPVGDAQVQIDGAVPGQLNLLDINGQVYNPTQFRLTTQDGYIYDLDERLGVTKITEPNGAFATFTTNGIFHSSGKSVTFIRNSTGQITQITDPNGNFVKYSYGFGTSGATMTAFTDAAGKVTNYGYTSVSDGFVLGTISDTRGTLLTNTWVGVRLTATTDIFGKTTSYNHDTTNQVETVTDRNNNPTTYTYDDHGNVTKMVDALNHVTIYTYDENDNKLSETNALGKTTSFSYDGRGNRASETDPLGHTTNYTYNGRGQVVTVKRASGQLVTMEYDQQGNTTSVTGPSGTLLTTTYNANGLPQITTDILNNTIQFEHDGQGNVTKHIDPAGTATTFTYDSAGNQQTRTVKRTTPSGLETLLTQYEYDKENRLTKATAADNTFTRVVYNTLGQKSETYDQLNRKTTYAYDTAGRLQKVTYPDLTFESYTYDNEDRRLTFTNRANHTTTYERDKLGRVTKVIANDGTFVTTHYDEIGRVDFVLDQKNHKTEYFYDDANRRTQVKDALGRITFFTYDDVGNLRSIKDARNNTTTFDYDANNRRIQTNHPDGTTDKVTYDNGGRITSRTDQNNKTTRFDYDQLSRLKKVTDALDQVTSFTYDEIGNRLTQTDAKLHTTSFEYDKLGRRKKRTLPGNQAESYTYDEVGNLKTRTDFNGKTTTYNYDSLNRLLNKVPDASFGAPSVTYTYNALGQRLTMSDVSGSTTYDYDGRDRLMKKTTPAGVLNYTYDSVSNLQTLTSNHTDGVATTYTYDELNRLASAADVNAGSASYTYDEVGNLATVAAGNSVQHTYTYNSLNRLTNLGVANSGQAIAGYTYTLDNVGNRTTIAEINGRVANYVYDGLYRLARESISGDAASQNGAIDYTYDAVGNRSTLTSTVPLIPSAGTLNYDANDRSSAENYDNNGNATTVRAQNNTYDFENRLVQRGNATVVYDGDGTRVAETVGSVTTRFLVDDLNPTGYSQVVEELRGGVVVRSYSYGLQRIAQRQFISVGGGGAWTTSYYSYDGHGSVRQLTDTAGNVTDSYTYDAFGNLLARTGSTPNNMLFAGEEFDPALGVYYNRARYYDPNTGRFWSMDTFEGYGSDPATLHKYTYAANDPVNLIDPSGNESLAEASASFTTNATIQAISTAVFRSGIQIAVGAVLGAAISGFRTAVLGGSAEDVARSIEDGLTTGALWGLAGSAASLLKLGAIFNFVVGLYFGSEALKAAEADFDAGHYGLAIMDIILAAVSFGAAASEVACETPGTPKTEAQLTKSPQPTDPFNILNKDFVPDPQRVLQNITNAQNGQLAANPSSARSVLSPKEIAASSDPRVGPMSYGNAVERLAAREIRTNALHKTLFQPVGGKSQPDFKGVGTASGVNLDITTVGQIKAHLARPGYGPGLQIVTYTRPAGFGGF